MVLPLKCQFCHQIELTGFYMGVTLVFNGSSKQNLFTCVLSSVLNFEKKIKAFFTRTSNFWFRLNILVFVHNFRLKHSQDVLKMLADLILNVVMNQVIMKKRVFLIGEKLTCETWHRYMFLECILRLLHCRTEFQVLCISLQILERQFCSFLRSRPFLQKQKKKEKKTGEKCNQCLPLSVVAFLFFWGFFGVFFHKYNRVILRSSVQLGYCVIHLNIYITVQ